MEDTLQVHLWIACYFTAKHLFCTLLQTIANITRDDPEQPCSPDWQLVWELVHTNHNLRQILRYNFSKCDTDLKVTHWGTVGPVTDKPSNRHLTSGQLQLIRQRSSENVHQIGRAMRKCIFGQMLTANAQISLHICAVWSGPLLSANRIFGHNRMYQWRANARMRRCPWEG